MILIGALGAQAVLAAIAQAETADDPRGLVALRGQAAMIEYLAAKPTQEALELELTDGTIVSLGWQVVREVNGPGSADSARFMAVSDRAWRAGARLDRGDAYAAEPLFEELFRTYGSMRGPTAVHVAEGLLRCRLRRGSQVQAVEPWSAALRAGALEPHAAQVEHVIAGGLIDLSTGLCPALPPMWTNGPSLQILTSLASPPAVEPNNTPAAAQGDRERRVADGLLSLYIHAARFEAGMATGGPGDAPAELENHPALWIVRSRTGNPEVRASARRVIADALKATDQPWLEAWYRAALGRSLVLEADRETRLLGVAQLLHIPARLAPAQPYLAGLCLAEASATMRDLGDTQAADRLRDELIRTYPDHPSIRWDRLTDAGAPHAPLAQGRSPN